MPAMTLTTLDEVSITVESEASDWQRTITFSPKGGESFSVKLDQHEFEALCYMFKHA